MLKSILVAILTLGVASTASADTFRLTYTGNPFASFYFFGSLPPDVYSSADRVTGTIELLAPLPANLVGGFVTPVFFRFSDGVNTLTSADVNLSTSHTTFQFWTDATGQIVNWAVNVFEFTPGVIRRTVQTINQSLALVPPGIPCGASCEVDSGTNDLCGPGVYCIDASGNLNIDPLYAQQGRVDALPGVWTTEEIIPFSFRGFFSPVDNDPVVNRVKAGAGVPVKFSLGGDRGLEIFQTGFPVSQPVACDNFATLSSVEETVSVGQSGLTYDALADQYTYVWKTQKSWANTCRQLVIRLADGSFHIADFQFDR